MPGSLLSRVRRSDSARSDRSDVSAKSGDSWKSSGKKVSFNRAVRVKKFPRRADALHDDPDDLDEKRFWFKVYKNNNRDPDGSLRRRENLEANSEEYANLPIRPLDPIAEIPPHKHKNSKYPEMRLTADVGVGTSGGTLHSSQQCETPTVRRNHVKKMVTKFNEEALLKIYEEDPPSSPTSRTHNGRPPEPPVDYASEGKHGQKKNPLVNGVKVIFGMANLKNKSKQNETKFSSVSRKNQANLRKNLFSEGRRPGRIEDGPPYRTSILLADEYATSKNNNNVYNKNNNYEDKEGRLSLVETNKDLMPSHIWDSGDQLVSDVTRYESTVDRNDQGGQTYKTIEEGNRVWKHETRTIYEEGSTSPVLSERRRAKSQGDLRGEEDSLDSHLSSRKGMSVEDLPGKSRKGVTKDRAVQCNRSKEREMVPSSASTLPSSHRVIRSCRDGTVSAYSDVPTLKVNGTGPKPKTQEAIYSQIDKNKKLQDKKSASTLSLNSRSPKVKSSQKSFGFRLKKAFGATLPEEKDKGNTYAPAKDEDGNWYDVDADVVAADERSKGHHDISEVRLEIEEERNGHDDKRNETGRKETPGSVVREVDHRKREIFYENTPMKSKTEAKVEAGGLWYRGAEEDYRREMANSDVSYPSGSHVGSASTLGRSSWLSHARNPSTTPKSYTLDRRHMRSKSPTNTNGSSTLNGSAVKILVNGQEVDDLDALTTKPQPLRKSGSSPRESTARGGLAAAYKARQKAALKRSNSLSGSRHSVSGLGMSSGASSTASASSDGETNRRRRTLVMYIPGVDHNGHRSDSDDRRSGVSRTQSLHALSKPSKYQKHVRKGNAHPRYSSSRNTSDASTVADEDGDTLTPLRSDTAKAKSTSSLGRKGELRRRHSMPKDTKFGWFKWKIKPKSRES